MTTIFGRKCHYPRVLASNPTERAFNERAAINAPLQGSAADIIRRAMIRMDAALEKANLSAKMLLQVHDELVFEAPNSLAAAAEPGMMQARGPISWVGRVGGQGSSRRTTAGTFKDAANAVLPRRQNAGC